MGKLKFIHTADLHLGTSFSLLSPEKSLQRSRELCRLPEKIMHLAGKENADAVLICGDLFDSILPEKSAVEAFISEVGQSDIPVFISPGNHDYYCAASIYAKTALPDNVFLFTKNDIEYYDFSESGFRVYGAAFQSEFSRPLLDGLRLEKVDGVADIMCLHGEVCRGDSSYCKITHEQIAGSNLDYLALGHVHKATGLLKAGTTYYSYSGCPEGRGYDETGIRTVTIAESDGSSWKIRTTELADRRVEELKLDVSGKDILTAITAALPTHCIQDIYSITVTGLTDSVPDEEKLRERLRNCFFDLKFTNQTVCLDEIFSEACETTLRGIFIGKIREMFDSATTEKDKKIAVNALRWGLAALEGNTEAVRHDDQ